MLQRRCYSQLRQQEACLLTKRLLLVQVTSMRVKVIFEHCHRLQERVREKDRLSATRISSMGSGLIVMMNRMLSHLMQLIMLLSQVRILHQNTRNHRIKCLEILRNSLLMMPISELEISWKN